MFLDLLDGDGDGDGEGDVTTVFVDLFLLSLHNSLTCLTYNPEQQEQEPAQQSASIMEIFHMKIEEYKGGNLTTSPIWIWFLIVNEHKDEIRCDICKKVF